MRNRGTSSASASSAKGRLSLAVCGIALFLLFTSTAEHKQETQTTPLPVVHSTEDSSNVLKKSPRVVLPGNVRFFHIGKAAGGTIQSRYNKIWNTGLKHCHPHPCIQPQWSTNKEAHPYIMLPLRDPIDRFHSSFYWRVLRVCHPDPEQQITNYKELQGRDWECEKGGNGNGYEGQAIHVTYQQNASKLALDLCSADPALEQAARKTISLLGHAQHNVRDWMAFDWQPERVYTIVVEKGFASIEDQTDEALRWIWNNTHFEDPSDFHRRSEYAYQHGPKIAQTPNGAHSSAALKEPLTPAAIHCLRSFYKEEYDFFSELSQKTCKNVRCEAAIENILIRRSWTGAN